MMSILGSFVGWLVFGAIMGVFGALLFVACLRIGELAGLVAQLRREVGALRSDFADYVHSDGRRMLASREASREETRAPSMNPSLAPNQTDAQDSAHTGRPRRRIQLNREEPPVL